MVLITTERRAHKALTVNPRNARRHSEKQIADIAASIRQFGYVNMISIKPSGEIIGGHATHAALGRVEGHDDVDVRVVAGLEAAQYAKLGVALNKLPEGSTWDDNILADILAEVEDSGGNLKDIGFSDKELQELREGAAELDVKEVLTSDVRDEFWVSVRGPLADQAQALKALQEVMAKFPLVTVDLGTIAAGP
jgi:ParB-like chromosome segregation protein Spo0J